MSQAEPVAVLEQAAFDFEGCRPRLFAVAYRVLGNHSEAEDIVQEVWLRWQMTDRTVVKDPPAFLATAAIRLAINVVQSARSRREVYVSPGLVAPVDSRSDPALGVERGEALERAALLLLEKLTPTERAVFVFREAFDYAYEEIAALLHLSEANARQLISRARRHLAGKRQQPVSAREQRLFLDGLRLACHKGDFTTLENFLVSGIVGFAAGDGARRLATAPAATCRRRAA